MAKQLKTFYCLRCQSRFVVEFDPSVVSERSCPECGSNSVRIETPIAAKKSQSEQPKTQGEKP